MQWTALALILAASLCTAASRCPDPRLRQATIGGDTITGSVVLHKRPLKFAQVRLYFSSGKAAWLGTTDANGGFVTNKLQPGNYRLDVSGRGTSTVQLNPDLDRTSFGQIPSWNLILIDNVCVDTTQIVN